ncbi:hypothetical protein PVAND_009209 [Polypedilum vanderplanki]|uniref:Uncharacterized protein n=1 Tax=Polypedilum vanderplanki TaxID=319348 RepID=A0A9J6CDE2_POLVA|nr:hypothetical protein PVAND_009209 [Polypedilum vanderplanki]
MKFISLAILICCCLNFSIGNSVTIESEYQCKVSNKEVFNGNRVTIGKAVGNHTDGMTDDDVKYFLIEEANLTYFPKNLGNIFKNLEMIAIYYSELIDITSEDLKPFPKLKYLRIWGNPIEVIREDLFIHNRELQVLALYDNEINHIDRKALSHLNNLRAVLFNRNKCKFGRNEKNV